MRRIHSKVLAAGVLAAALVTMPCASRVVQASPAETGAASTVGESSSEKGEILPLAEVSIGSLAAAIVVGTVLQKRDRGRKKAE